MTVTVEIPEDLANRLRAEADARGLSVDEVAAEALGERFGPRRRTLSFAAAGSSVTGHRAADAEDLMNEGDFGIDSADR